MRFKGTLTEWNDDRGFGFIEPAEGGSRVFCHIKAFDVRVRRPIAGDKLTYEVSKDAQGRLNAVKVRPVGLEEAQYQSNIKTHRSSTPRRSSSFKSVGISIVLLAAVAIAGLSYFKHNQSALTTTDDEPIATSTLKTETKSAQKTPPPSFQCDGRTYCSQMNSRAEAEFFIKHCPGTKMDGDNDGVPCENDSRF
jgi:cold shock CspA family protein